MKPQVSTGRGYTRRGNDHEHPLILQLWKQCVDGKACKASFKALYRHGLVVSKKSDSFHVAVKDSFDTAGIYVEELEDSSSPGSEGGNELKSAWDNVLRYIDRSLKWAYAPIANDPEATIKSILESDSMKCFKVDYEAFEPWYLAEAKCGCET
jgi:hypothetical protein